MSIENVAKFFQQLLQNDKQSMEQLKKAKTAESFIQQTVQIGQEKGYVFNPKDLTSYLSEQKIGTISDQELGVADGAECPFSTRFTVCVGISGCWASLC